VAVQSSWKRNRSRRDGGFLEKKDFFDRLMECRIFKPIQPIWKRCREGILYLFFGGLTFFLAVLVYFVADTLLGIDPLAANIISWISGVTFSFFTTRKWVFHSETSGMRKLLEQIAAFAGARLATLLLQEVLIFIFVTRLKFISIIVKLATEVINIILNYLASKFLIFKNK
jgi:putative flippase GtrA